MVKDGPVRSVQCDLSRDHQDQDCGHDRPKDLMSVQINALRSDCIAECAIWHKEDDERRYDSVSHAFEELDFVE